MARTSRRTLHRLPAAAVATAAVAALALVAPAPAPAQEPSPGDCIKAPGQAELYGPTDLNGQTGNQGLSVGLNDEGTLTVLRWPSPSYYDQVRHTTESRDLPDLGVAPNEGAFLGLVVERDGGSPETTWLRDWNTTQAHAEGLTDELVTTHRRDDLGLTVAVRDVVTHPDDVWARQVAVERHEASPVTAARLLAYENLSLVVSKQPLLPVQDWCYESQNTDHATFDPALDAVVHEKQGTDASTGEASTAALAMGFASGSDGVQVGWDAAEPAPTDGRSAPTDAYEDAADGRLQGAAEVEGHTTATLSTPLPLGEGAEPALLLVTAAADPTSAGDLLDDARDRGYDDLVASKQAWLDGLLGDAPLPAADDPRVVDLARRALVTLVTDVDRESGAIVASIATQSPYGEDWPRDGAFFDYALDLIGLHDWVDRHHDFYVDTQMTADDPDPVLEAIGVPPGNWGMNYYADGVVGGPIPWEIDETGYTLWNVWEHHRATGDLDALASRYDTVALAADFLAECRDDATGLQCPALEDDNLDERQTIVGASTVWLGLDSAAEVAEALGHDDDAARWSARRDELAEAIEAEMWDGQVYGQASAPLVWPACFAPLDDERMASHLDATWERIAPTFAEPGAGERERGQYEAKTLLAAAKAWKDDPARMDDVRAGLSWLAEHHATPDTGVMGEVWELRDGEVVTTVSQPHAWEQVLFYLAALEAWPPAGAADAPAGCDGVTGLLRSPDAGPPAPAPAEDAAGSDETGGGAVWWAAAVVVGVTLAAGMAAVLVRSRRRS